MPEVWKRSTRCGTTTCVEVTTTAAGVLVRDAKDPDGPVLDFGPDVWDRFLNGINSGMFDVPRGTTNTA